MTDKEKAEYYDEWHEYFEPLARIRREVVRALPNFNQHPPHMIRLLVDELEIRPEIENLIRTMLIEIEESND